MVSFGKYIVSAMVAVGISSSVHAAWVAPVNGWDVNYEASSGLRPDQASPAWANDRYEAADAQVIDEVIDPVSGATEKTLSLNHVNQDRRFYLTDPFTSASGTDLITIDARFRLTDDSQPADRSQLRFLLFQPTGVAGKRHIYLLDIALGQINFSTASGAASGSSALLAPSTGWHDLRWHIDVASNTAAVYLDGSDTPLFSHAGTTIDSELSVMEFGDNSGSVHGRANLSYLRLTNNELAAVPEPAGLSLLAAACIMLNRRRKIG